MFEYVIASILLEYIQALIKKYLLSSSMIKKLTLTVFCLALFIAACSPQTPDGPQLNCDYSNPEKNYIGRSKEACDTMRFMCAEGTEYFADECGCGCKPSEQDSFYVQDGDCSIAAVSCPVGMEAFEDDKGCGCRSPDASGAAGGTQLAKHYVIEDPQECKTALFQCEDNEEAFFDEQGCGCQPKADSTDTPMEGKLQATDCTQEQRGAEICTMEYRPVCGWFDSTKIQCVKYPCANTYSNPCQACANEEVISWTEGECPQ